MVDGQNLGGEVHVMYKNTCIVVYIYIYMLPPQRSTFFVFFCYFCFCRKHWKINRKKEAAMAWRKRDQEFLQVLESDNLAGKGMSEA